MNAKEQWDYRRVLAKKLNEITSEEPKTITEKHINNLKYMLYQIQPQSRYWKYGMIKTLRWALKLAEKENKKLKSLEVSDVKD